MRRPTGMLASLTLALFLTACGQGAPDMNDSMSRDLLSPPPAVIPDRFIGTWDISAVACRSTTPGEMRLVVEPGLMRFYESLVKVQEVHPVAKDDAVDVDATSTGEGVMESRRYRLTPSGKNGLDVTVMDTTAHRVRCPQG